MFPSMFVAPYSTSAPGRVDAIERQVRGKLTERHAALVPERDVERLFTPISHRDSSRNACKAHTDCRSNERRYTNQCIRPLDAWGEWYGLGVFLIPDSDYAGLPRYVEHGGDQTGAHTQFKLDRQTKNGIVVFVAGESSWTKQGVTYGASPLLADILSAYGRNY